MEGLPGQGRLPGSTGALPQVRALAWPAPACLPLRCSALPVLRRCSALPVLRRCSALPAPAPLARSCFSRALPAPATARLSLSRHFNPSASAMRCSQHQSLTPAAPPAPPAALPSATLSTLRRPLPCLRRETTWQLQACMARCASPHLCPFCHLRASSCTTVQPGN